MSKKDKNIIRNNQTTESTEYKKLFTIIIIITVIFLIFYLLTTFLTKDNNDDIFNNNLEASEIQYDEIIIGTMFDKKGTYYVLLETKDDPYQEIFDSYITTIRSGKTKIYTVDLSNALNKIYIHAESNYKEDDFKVNKTVLLKMQDGKIKNSYDVKIEISKKLKELSENAQ